MEGSISSNAFPALILFGHPSKMSPGLGEQLNNEHNTEEVPGINGVLSGDEIAKSDSTTMLFRSSPVVTTMSLCGR